MPDAWNRQRTSKPGRLIKKPRKWMNPGWQTPCKSMKKKVGGMSQPKNSQALKMTVDFCHTPCLFFCLIRLFFCLSKTVWSSLGILVLSVGCFSFCGMKSCESWWLEFGIPYKPCMGLIEAEHMQANWTRKKTGGWKEHGKTTSFFRWRFQTFFITVLFTPKIWGIQFWRTYFSNGFETTN